MSIIIKDIYKKFSAYTALDNINLEIKTGELLALIGPSGSGKTTLLRIIAGLEFADQGSISTHGEDSTNKPLKDREIGFVFQHYALFKHMNIFDNVAFGLRMKPKEMRLSDIEINQKVESLLKLVHINRLADRYPSQISGGQRQRAALARALAVEPKILLLDEPFGALDSKVRKELRRWMRRLHDNIDLTSIFVTHDQEEAMEVADRIVLMNNGKIEQIGTPQEVYHHPNNSFVYDFLGNYNLFDGYVDNNGDYHILETNIYDENSSINLKKQPDWAHRNKLVSKFISLMKPSSHINVEKINLHDSQIKSERVKIFSRPHDMEILTIPNDKECINVKLNHINPAGPLVKLELEKSNGLIIQAEISHEYFNQLNLKKGDYLFTYPKEIKIFN
ncbi:MAG: sulfate/molybdate ABC transporter ATP-binding protein [Alphaproteobacteria bacterium]